MAKRQAKNEWNRLEMTLEELGELIEARKDELKGLKKQHKAMVAEMIEAAANDRVPELKNQAAE